MIESKIPSQDEIASFLQGKLNTPAPMPNITPPAPPIYNDFDNLLSEHVEKVPDIITNEDGYIQTFYNTDGFHNYLRFRYDNGYLIVSNSMSKKSNRTIREIRITISYLGAIIQTARKWHEMFITEISSVPQTLYVPVVQNIVSNACMVDMTQIVIKAEPDSEKFSNLFQIRIEKLTADVLSGKQKIQLYQWIKLENALDIIHILAVMHRIGQKVKGL